MNLDAMVALVVGVALCAASRTIADSFRVPGNRSTLVKFAGMADDDWSRLYRWVVCVLTGLIFIGVGVGGLLSQ